MRSRGYGCLEYLNNSSRTSPGHLETLKECSAAYTEPVFPPQLLTECSVWNQTSDSWRGTVRNVTTASFKWRLEVKSKRAAWFIFDEVALKCSRMWAKACKVHQLQKIYHVRAWLFTVRKWDCVWGRPRQLLVSLSSSHSSAAFSSAFCDFSHKYQPPALSHILPHNGWFHVESGGRRREQSCTGQLDRPTHRQNTQKVLYRSTEESSSRKDESACRKHLIECKHQRISLLQVM